MPDPKKFKTQESFMKVCVPEVKSEGRDQKAAVGKCLGMWRNRNKVKKSADLAGNILTPEVIKDVKEK